MNADQLRATQAPLKQRYRDEPAAARIVSRAVAVLDQARIAARIEGREGPVVAGLHAAAGGDGSLACSADMLLEAVVGCAGVTFCAVATASGVAIRAGRVIAEGVWDARGTLGVDRAVPVAVTEVSLRFEIDCDAPPEKLARMVETTERYCVVLQTLRHPPAITVAKPG
jgi:uncharacterized OsmC-like protein